MYKSTSFTFVKQCLIVLIFLVSQAAEAQDKLPTVTVIGQTHAMQSIPYGHSFYDRQMAIDITNSQADILKFLAENQNKNQSNSVQ